MKYFCKIRFVGTDFSGYQVQRGGNKRTVQGELNLAAERLFGVSCAITGCSRTDSGVHADGFALTIALPDGSTPIHPSRLPHAMKACLPPDISLYFATAVPDDFHARYDVDRKTYVYRIHTAPVPNPFMRLYSWHVPYRLDLALMQTAAEKFLGTHDFSAFMAAGSKITSPVRTVYESRVEASGEEILFTVTADGFLYNMVRIMAGTLLEVGQGKIPPERIPEILRRGERKNAGRTAPPEGLVLKEVQYKTADFGKDCLQNQGY